MTTDYKDSINEIAGGLEQRVSPENLQALEDLGEETATTIVEMVRAQVEKLLGFDVVPQINVIIPAQIDVYRKNQEYEYCKTSVESSMLIVCYV